MATYERPRIVDARIPPIGSVPQLARAFRLNWVANELRSPSGIPLVTPDFVAQQGSVVRLVDVREPDELVGPLGYIPGVDWVLPAAADRLRAVLPIDYPIVFISRGGERAGELAQRFEQAGHPFVAAMQGGMVAWKMLGFDVSRDPAILETRDRVSPPETIAQAEKGAIDLPTVEDHICRASTVRWLKLAGLLVHGRMSCVDGRDHRGVVGTPGGDLGEMLLSLAAFERVTGEVLDEPRVRALVRRRLDRFGRLYLHSDGNTSNVLIKSFRSDRRLDDALVHVWESLEWRHFLMHPPVELHDVLLEHILVPEHLGCGHLRLAMQRSAEYGARPELARALLSAFFRESWAGSVDTEYVVLPGGHAESGVLSIVLDEQLESFSSIPLISPSAGGHQVFVIHPQVAGYLRQQFVRFLERQSDLVSLDANEAAQFPRVIDELAGQQAAATLGALAKGLPHFEVRFSGGEPTVTPLGTI